MTLATQAANPVPAVQGVTYTCHVAVWYWAAREAQALGLSAVKTTAAIIGNIAGMNPGAQPAMLALPRSGKWDFSITPTTPPVGYVLVWPAGSTHVAVVTAANQITGYNQVLQFPHLIPNRGHTTATPAQLAANHRQCVVIDADTVVARAGALGL